jgi:hypothetical protein
MELDCPIFERFNIKLIRLLISSNIMIIVSKNWRTFEILENNEVKGSLTYKNMFMASADIQTVNDGNHILNWSFSLISKKFRITQNDKESIKLKMNWKGDFTITLENGIEYKSVTKGFLKRQTFIENQESRELIEISQKYNWKRWRYNYEIGNSETPQNDLLSLIAVYALNYQSQYLIGIMTACIFSTQFIADFLIK